MKKYSYLIIIALITLQANAQNHNLLIGTYTNKGTSEGIYTYNFDAKTGETQLKSIAKNTVNPSYLALSSNNKFVYAVNENGKNSTLSAFSFNTQSGDLTFLNQQNTQGADPCFVTLNNKHVFTANYSGGSLTVFSRNADGTLSNAKQIINHTGKSINQKRQASAHVHQIQFTPDKKYLICTDLGEDQVYVYNYNANIDNEILTLKKIIKVTAGTGPRHLTFSPNGKFAYLAHEFNGNITGFNYVNGNLNKIEEVATIAKDFSGRIDGADIHTSPDGKFLYQTNRGDANTINVFAILKTGKLQFIESVSTLGKGPRNFSISPNGCYLLVAHQYSNNVVIFNRNKTTGKLTASGKTINVGAPVCLVFAK